MESATTVIDVDLLKSDLSRAVRYATRAGLLRDKDLLDAVKAADRTLLTDKDPDVQTISLAINGVVQAIAPMTLADLNGGRDPFDQSNQQRARTLQFVLSIFALVVLFLIGYSMNALRVEQGAIAELNDLVELHPDLKLTALRMIAENDQPTAKKSALFDAYHQKMNELKEINGRMSATYLRALEASNYPLFPLSDWLTLSGLSSKAPSNSYSSALPTDETPQLTTALPPQAVVNVVSGPGSPNAKTPAPANSVQDTTAHPTDSSASTSPLGGDLCGQGADGNMQLPKEASRYPLWMRIVLSDTLSDFCFQLKVLSPDGQGTVLNQSMEEIAFIPHIKDKVSLRVTWFLPFMYGLLGSVVFLMRTVSSIRTPAMEWYAIIMRLALGGVAGIVMGWFSAAASSSLQSTSSLSLPFALAFLTGYGIDALFSILDRLSQSIGEMQKNK